MNEVVNINGLATLSDLEGQMPDSKSSAHVNCKAPKFLVCFNKVQNL